MNYQTISEIYEANDKIRNKLKTTIENLSDEQLNFRPDEYSWTIAQIVEHLSIVENGMARICAKLLHQSAEENLPNDGKASLSQEFLKQANDLFDDNSRKLQAPDRVLPKGELNIQQSFAKMQENAQILEQLRPTFEKLSAPNHKFPHPFFGDLSATEWLALIGGHEFRHIKQIERILLERK